MMTSAAEYITPRHVRRYYSRQHVAVTGDTDQWRFDSSAGTGKNITVTIPVENN